MIHVIDNFLDDPYSVRALALKAEYGPDPNGNWPGKRNEFVPDFIKDVIKKQVDKITGNETKFQACSFQYSTSQMGEGSFHCDHEMNDHNTTSLYTSVLFLSENNDIECGTEVCEYKVKIPKKLWENHLQTKKNFYLNGVNRRKHLRLVKRVNSYIKPNYIVPCKFNRMLFFPGHYPHRPQNFYGSSIENSRLTIVSFLTFDQ